MPLDKTIEYPKLIAAAKEASDLAYRPYSNYPVGAAVLTFDGKIYTGCNVENCGYTQTIHAEQTAMSKAISEGALKRALNAGVTQLDFIVAVAIHAQKGTDPWPCCNCRQSLNEFGLSMDIIGETPEGTVLSETLGELIPHAFAMELVLASVYGDDWRIAAANAGSVNAADAEESDADNGDIRRKLIHAAKNASRLAYCPYSKYPVGAAILTFDDRIYVGCNIENCGYTQTIHADQVAMAKAVSEGALKRAEAAGLNRFQFIKSIAVYSPKTKEPWPSCNGRQSLSEFGLDLEVIGEGQNGGIVTKQLRDLIPFPFEPETVLTSIRSDG